MKQDILYLKSHDTFYQMTKVDDDCIHAVKIRKDSKVRADYLMWSLAGGTSRHYIVISDEKHPVVEFRTWDNDTGIKCKLISFKFKRRQLIIKFIKINHVVDDFVKIVMPLTRQMFPSIIAKDLVGVESLPQGAFALYNKLTEDEE